MFKHTALITWRPETDEADRASLLRKAEAAVDADFSYFGAGLTPPSFRGGDVVWHLHFQDRAAWEASGAESALDIIEADSSVADLDAAAYSVERRAIKDSALAGGVYRTLFIAVGDMASRDDWRELSEDLAAMPAHIPEIVNWAMNETVASRGHWRWTHVWEQEFASVEDLSGPYLASPYHICHVDRWFDPEMPCCIIAPDGIRHSASELRDSVMRRY